MPLSFWLEILEGQVACANVVKNRVLSPVTWWGKTWKEVMLKPYQFSCFNENDPNMTKMSEAWENKCTNLGMKQAAWVAKGIICGELKDNTKGATHYHSIGIGTPKWAMGQVPLMKIGNHLFYRLTN